MRKVREWFDRDGHVLAAALILAALYWAMLNAPGPF